MRETGSQPANERRAGFRVRSRVYRSAAVNRSHAPVPNALVGCLKPNGGPGPGTPVENRDSPPGAPLVGLAGRGDAGYRIAYPAAARLCDQAECPGRKARGRKARGE